ncbi:MAG: hypothetical protein AVDCRST_MAG85-3131, partial [uncultured Solirubrobacteraceae bacterium]
ARDRHPPLPARPRRAGLHDDRHDGRAAHRRPVLGRRVRGRRRRHQARRRRQGEQVGLLGGRGRRQRLPRAADRRHRLLAQVQRPLARRRPEPPRPEPREPGAHPAPLDADPRVDRAVLDRGPARQRRHAVRPQQRAGDGHRHEDRDVPGPRDRPRLRGEPQAALDRRDVPPQGLPRLHLLHRLRDPEPVVLRTQPGRSADARERHRAQPGGLGRGQVREVLPRGSRARAVQRRALRQRRVGAVRQPPVRGDQLRRPGRDPRPDALQRLDRRLPEPDVRPQADRRDGGLRAAGTRGRGGQGLAPDLRVGRAAGQLPRDGPAGGHAGHVAPGRAAAQAAAVELVAQGRRAPRLPLPRQDHDRAQRHLDDGDRQALQRRPAGQRDAADPRRRRDLGPQRQRQPGVHRLQPASAADGLGHLRRRVGARHLRPQPHHHRRERHRRRRGRPAQRRPSARAHLQQLHPRPPPDHERLRSRGRRHERRRPRVADDRGRDPLADQLVHRRPLVVRCPGRHRHRHRCHRPEVPRHGRPHRYVRLPQGLPVRRPPAFPFPATLPRSCAGSVENPHLRRTGSPSAM